MAWTHVGAAVAMVALGTQWPVIDLPYPDVPDGGGAPELLVPAETQVQQAICRYSRAHHGPRPDIAQLRIDGTRATALVTSGSSVEWVHLEQLGSEWRVVQTFAHR